MNQEKNFVAEGSPPSAEDSFYFRWGQESLKNNLTLANDILRQLVTLNSALLGGSVAFIDKDILPTPFKIFVILSFLLSLFISFLGVMPYERYVDLHKPQEIKAHKQSALSSKLFFLKVSGLLMAIGFAISLAGIIAKWMA